MLSATTPLIDVRDILRLAASHSPKGHPHIGSEHIALAALDGPTGLRAIAAEAGLDPDSVAPALAACCTDAIERATDHPEITPRTAVLAAMAAQAAWADGAIAIGSEHVLRALLEEPGAIAWTGLRRVGLTPAVVFDALVRRRDQPWPSPARDALGQILGAMQGPIHGWHAFAVLPAEERPANCEGDIARFRSAVNDLAALGLRLGVLGASESDSLTGSNPEAAVTAFYAAASRLAPHTEPSAGTRSPDDTLAGG